MSQQINILMTGAGAPGAAGIIRCLQQDPMIHVVAADANPTATGKWLAPDFVQIPFAEDPAFIESLLSICRQKNIHVLLPLVTRELLPLANHLAQFEGAGVKLLISPPESLEVANDKGRLYQFLQWRDIPTPAFSIVETIDQFKTAASDLGYPSKTICFKPTRANGSRGFRIIAPKIDERKLLFEEKPSSTYIDFDHAIRIFSSGPFPELLVSEWLPGAEYSVDCLALNGEPVLIVPRLRTRMIGGISVAGEFVGDHAIMEYCRKIIKELRLHGNIGIQVKIAESGEALILEINPRVQGTISAGLGAGVNLPLLAVKYALQIPVRPEELEIKWGTKFSRFWNEVFY